MLCAYLACNRVFTEGTCKLLTLIITDLVDEDVVLNDRRRGVSALIFGSAAFLSKPGQTLAPLVGTALIAMETGKEVFAGEGSWSDMTMRQVGRGESCITGWSVVCPSVCQSVHLISIDQVFPSIRLFLTFLSYELMFNYLLTPLYHNFFFLPADGDVIRSFRHIPPIDLLASRRRLHSAFLLVSVLSSWIKAERSQKEKKRRPGCQR